MGSDLNVQADFDVVQCALSEAIPMIGFRPTAIRYSQSSILLC